MMPRRQRCRGDGANPLSAPSTSSAHAGYNPNRLFLLSCVSLVTAAFVFSIRAAIIPELAEAFGMNNEKINGIAGLAFLGFALTVFIGSPACDWVGMGRLLFIAGALHIAGAGATIFAKELSGGGSVETILSIGMFTVGLAHGLVEAVINPLAATIYPEEKTHKLNVLHAWWPGGLVLGGLIATFLGQAGMNWQVKQAVVLIPAILYVALLIGQKFPQTERVTSGVSNADMFKQAANPLFLAFLFCMLLTASMELAPNQLLETLSKTIGMEGTLVLSYVSFLMFAMRFFAGPVAHKLSPIGLLWTSSLLTGIGLIALSYSQEPIVAMISATIFAVGVCYVWPTMLSVTSELFPKGGALLMGLMATFGNIAIYFILPEMGKITDAAVKSNLANGMAEDAAKAAAAPIAFRYVGALPLVLIIVFGAIWMVIRARGGYRAILSQEASALAQGA